MKARHNTRMRAYRQPFGAAAAGTEVTLALHVWEEPAVECLCRVWVDGTGESLFPMQRAEQGEQTVFSCRLQTKEPEIIWYSFILKAPDGRVFRYGAEEGRTGGEGRLYDREPPSFQLTVYAPRALPEWYRTGLVYQIFPDRYRRGQDWRSLAEAALKKGRRGPERRLVEDWDSVPFYSRDATGRVRAWDFYGGTLSGIREDLPRLKRLGVTALYLNPVFEAASNHRYDTGDYKKVDALLGGEEAFRALAVEAEKAGISIILDGVFNHTGCDSLYFNKYGNYNTLGAFQSPESPFRDWYSFNDSPAGYECWWGVDDLPDLQESAAGVKKLILEPREGVIAKWLKAGAKGWRLDVADELSDDFIAEIKAAAIAERGEEALLLGEVWEDASNKISYGKLRRYFLGNELDSVMNYPLREGVTRFLLGEIPASALVERLISLKENYPPTAFYGALNLMGSHDRPRILTVLGEAPEDLRDEEKRRFRLSPEQRRLAKGRVWLMTLLQMTLPGVPCIFYGDEAGLEGYADPYNRGPYPWGREDPDLLAMYRNAVGLRRLSPVFTEGAFLPFACGDEVFGFWRKGEGLAFAVLVNRSRWQEQPVEIPAVGAKVTELVEGREVRVREGRVRLTLSPLGSAVLLFCPVRRWEKPMPPGRGVLCHITSLPCGSGKGHIGEPAERFIDFLADSGLTYWQMLPLSPVDEFGSPYAGTSAFAAGLHLLPESEEELREEFRQFAGDEAFTAYKEENRDWLWPFAWFSALKKKYGGRDWRLWPEEDRNFPPGSAVFWEDEKEAEFQAYCQYRFDRKWARLKDYAHARGVLLIGDLPMYVNADSADVWAARSLFTVDENGALSASSGVPPDDFSKEGQHWGMPLFNWEEMRREGCGWWLERLKRAFSLYDYVRMDHFRGYEAYWSIPAGCRALQGDWVPGPGTEPFAAAFKRFGPLPVLAETLGVMTPAVRGVANLCGFPEIDVLQFAGVDPFTDWRPPEGKVVFSGTHDNQTLKGWCAERWPEKDPEEAAEALLQMLYLSDAEVVILPLQDIIGLGDEARMNTPGTRENNWCWQAKPEELKKAAGRMKKLQGEKQNPTI